MRHRSTALALVGVTLLAASAATSTPRYERTPPPTPGGVPARTLRAPEYEPGLELPAAIADRDAPADQLRYAQQAAALPLTPVGRWVNVGPKGQDDPADYPTGSLRFARSAGMGVALAVDPRDASGNTLFAGSMGGLWHTRDAGAHWTPRGDSFARASVGAVGIDPQRPDDVYVGTGISKLTTSGDAPGSGVYVSHDGGTTFTRPANNVRGYAVNAILVVPSGVLVGTSNGLYVSTNRGASFSRVALPTNAAHTAPATGAYANWITAIVASPVNANLITVATGMPRGKQLGPDNQPYSPGNGLYRSTAGATGAFTYLAGSAGLTHPAASADPLGRIQLAYGPTAGSDTPVLWAIVSDAGLAAGKQPASMDFVSETTGESLNATNTVLNGVYRSNDDGATWAVKATPQSLTTTVNEGLGVYPALGYGVGVQAFYNLWIAADPSQPDVVFFGLEEVFQSLANTGDTPGLGEFEIVQRYWDVCGSTTYLENIFKGQTCPDETPYYGGVSTHPDQHIGAVATLDDGIRLYTGNDGGFFRQDSHELPDGRVGFDNDNWTEMNTLASVQPYKVARKPDGEYLTALQDNGGGFFPRGGTATLVSSGDGTNAIATSDPDTFYFSAQGAIVFVTTDGGRTLRAIPSGIAGASFLSPLAIDPTDHNHLVVAGREIAETTKGSDTQSTIDPLTYTVVSTDWTVVFDAGASPTVNNGAPVNWGSQAVDVRGAAVYSAICGLCRNALGDPKLIRTTVATNVEPGCAAKKAAADCWRVADGAGLPHVAINGIAIDPRDVQTIYVALNENSMIGYDQKIVGSQRVMMSRDAGETFTDITGNLPRSNARDVVYRDGKLIVATDHGVFTAPAGTATWSRLGTSLPPVRIFDLSLDPTGRYLTAAAYGRGVWELDFRATAASSSGPGPRGEPTRPSTGGTTPATGTNGVLALVGVALLGAAVLLRPRSTA